MRGTRSGRSLAAAVLALGLGLAAVSACAVADQAGPGRSADGSTTSLTTLGASLAATHLTPAATAVRTAVGRAARTRHGLAGLRWQVFVAGAIGCWSWVRLTGRSTGERQLRTSWWLDAARPRGPPRCATA